MLAAYKKIWLIIYRINTNPNRNIEWEIIKSEPDSIEWHLKKIVIPVVLAITVVTFAGYLFASRIYSYSLIYASIRAIAAFCESFFTLYVSFLLIYELCPKLGIISGRNSLFKIMTYSFTTFWVALFASGLLANYKTLDDFLPFLGLFGIYLFWHGSESLLAFAEGKKEKFIMIAVAIVLAVYILIHWSFGFALTAAHFPVLFN
jgi:hypothetical protein